MAYISRNLGRSFALAIVLVTISLSARVNAYCPWGNCGWLGQCLVVCESCATSWPYTYCFDEVVQCYFGIVDITRTDHNGDPEQPCYYCDGMSTSFPVYCYE
jgi:hypothetical protein